MVVNFFTDADWFTFSPAEMVNFLAAINTRVHALSPSPP